MQLLRGFQAPAMKFISWCVSKFHHYVVFSKAWCVSKFRHYVVFSRAILFILGFIFSYKLVDVALFSILITHLTDEWKSNNLPKAVIVVNLHEGTYEVLKIFFAFLTDAYTGLFKMMVCSTTIYIIGLWLIFVAVRVENFLDLGVFYTALVLVTFSQAAVKVTLEPFFGDQMLAKDHPITEEDEERSNSRCDFWWNFVSLLASIVAVFGLSDSFKILSMVSAIVTLAAFIWFLFGTKFYIFTKPIGSPLGDVVFIVYTAVTKRNVEYPESPEQLFQNSSGLVQILPDVSWLRWLDKAAVLVPQDEEKPGNNIWTVEQVKGVKYLLKMVPIWTTFLTFSVVSATGSTFFLEEATNINEDFPILFFIILERFTKFVVANTSNYVLEKLEKKKNYVGQKLMLVRMGIGMVCCVVCCIAAWINARDWLRLVEINTVDPERYMSVFRLTPQYMLLGIMDGLCEDGLENFFVSQVSESIARYGTPFEEFVNGVGKFLSVVCILVLTNWFKWFNVDVNSSRLDKFYALLAILSFVNMIVYWLVAYWYGDERFLAEDDEAGDIEMANSIDQAFQEEDGLPLLNLQEKCQETTSPSNLNDHETEKLKPDITDGRSDAPLLSGVRSFSHPSSKGLHKRFNSMH